MYRELYKPFHKRVNDWIHQNTTWKIFYHTCGSIVDLLDDLVDVGVDIINPVQCSAKGMEAKGSQSAATANSWCSGAAAWIHSGRCPSARRKRCTIRCAAHRRLQPGGGFVFNTIHNVQQNVPVENLMAMVRALKDASR